MTDCPHNQVHNSHDVVRTVVSVKRMRSVSGRQLLFCCTISKQICSCFVKTAKNTMKLSPMFCSRSFMVQGLRLKSLIHSELILCMKFRWESNFILWFGCTVSQNIYWRVSFLCWVFLTSLSKTCLQCVHGVWSFHSVLLACFYAHIILFCSL